MVVNYIAMFIAGVAYTIFGFVMNELVTRYMAEMVQKVGQIDERFAKRLFFNVTAKSETVKDVKSVIMFLFWPITYIAVILKAEWEYGCIKQACYRKEAP